MSDLAAFAEAIATKLPGQVSQNASAAEFTTWRVGGPLAVLVRAQRSQDLEVLAELGVGALPVLAVGRGSNLLIADEGFAGVALTLSGEFENIEIREDSVRAGGAVALPVLARRAAAAGHDGLEFYVGIPGSVGGAVHMNAGGHGRETQEVLQQAWIADLQTTGVATPWNIADLDFSYRHSSLGEHHVVTQAEFATTEEDPKVCEERLTEIVRWRREHQPGGANAGSVFQNPPDDSAGRLIEAAGCKGLRVGGAEVSPKHANFIQAENGATARDVRDLMNLVQERVQAACGVTLQSEVRMVGWNT